MKQNDTKETKQGRLTKEDYRQIILICCHMLTGMIKVKAQSELLLKEDVNNNKKSFFWNVQIISNFNSIPIAQ